mgnify:CR=1 FL=1
MFAAIRRVSSFYFVAPSNPNGGAFPAEERAVLPKSVIACPAKRPWRPRQKIVTTQTAKLFPSALMLFRAHRKPQAALARTLHDRLIAVDDSIVWVLTQSLNAFATRSPASIVRVDDQTAALKIAAYADVWPKAAVPLSN